MNFYASHFQNSYINQCRGQSYAKAMKKTQPLYLIFNRVCFVLCYTFYLSIVRLLQGHSQYDKQIMVSNYTRIIKRHHGTRNLSLIPMSFNSLYSYCYFGSGIIFKEGLTDNKDLHHLLSFYLSKSDLPLLRLPA